MQKYHSQSIWQKINKITARLLVVIIVANILNIFVAPQVAHAAGMVRYPSGDISAAGTWAVFPTSPTTKWDKVDEVGANDGDTTYLTHGNTAGSALFSFSAFSIPAGSTIVGVTVNLMARDVNSGTNKVQSAIRVNSTDYLTTSTSTEVPAAYGTISYAFTTNPNTTAAWTVADINGTGSAPLQGFGIRSADANPAFRITQVYATVNYRTMTVSTDQGSYPTSGATISATGTVYNNSTISLTPTSIDYVIFIDTNADGMPTAGETYITAACAGSAAWASGNYTFQTTGLTVNNGASSVDNQSCANTNFPSNTTYTIWTKWYNGATIYATAYATFTSVPTLGEILFLIFVGCMVFIGIKSGVIKLKLTETKPTDRKPPKDIPELPHKNHQRSSDGTKIMPEKEL